MTMVAEWSESVLRDALQGSDDDSDTWGAAQRIATMNIATVNGVGSIAEDSIMGGPADRASFCLETESSHRLRTGKEPTHAEVKEYLERHNFQAFVTKMVAFVAEHLPPDPFEFLLSNMQEIVTKHLEADKGDMTASAPISPMPQSIAPEQREKIVKRVAQALEHPELTKASGGRLFRQFATKSEEKMAEDEFLNLLKNLENNWGLQPDDTKLMHEVLRRWRFRANAANGTRGFPLWPLSKEDFEMAYPSMLRATRDRYVPIGAVHRSIFIRKIKGIVRERYDVGRRLGRGAFGEVLLLTLKETQEKRVCKRIFQQQAALPDEEVAGEVDLLRGLDHPHIIRIFEYFEEDGYINIVMEPVLGGTLSHVIEGLYLNQDGQHVGARPAALTEERVAVAFGQMLSALMYAHEVVGVIHKDLKCDNVLLVERRDDSRSKLSPEERLRQPVHVMLADFGIAEVFNPAAVTGGNSPVSPGLKGRSSRVGGTRSYMSPEMFQGSFTEKSDLWSLGVMLYRTMTGCLPYKADNILQQANIVSSPRYHPKWEVLSAYHWSLGAKKLCQELLIKDEGMRPSAAEALKSPWIIEAKASQKVATMDEAEKGAMLQQQSQSHLMRMAMHCITSQMNLSQMHNLNLQFKKYDGSGDGRLALSEMRQVLEDSGIRSAEDIDLIVEALDMDHSGKIEYSEFITGCLDISSRQISDQIPVAFSIFDLDNSNFITADELRLVLTHGANDRRPLSMSMSTPFGSSLSGHSAEACGCSLLPDGKTVEKVMKELDADKNGKVDCFELERYLLREHKRITADLEAKQAADDEAQAAAEKVAAELAAEEQAERNAEVEETATEQTMMEDVTVVP